LVKIAGVDPRPYSGARQPPNRGAGLRRPFLLLLIKPSKLLFAFSD
jgi:hypothetical protein